jgi:hypothetical protein
MNPQTASFFLCMKSGLKVKRRRKKREKSREKKPSNFIVCMRFYTGRKISLIKKACFMLNFLNLNSFSWHRFFFVVAHCESFAVKDIRNSDQIVPYFVT